MGWRRRTYVGEKTATSIHTDDDDDDNASWAQTLIDRLLVDGGRQRKTGDVRASKYRFRRNAKSFGGTALVIQ